jgi:hypothetical protein
MHQGKPVLDRTFGLALALAAAAATAPSAAQAPIGTGGTAATYYPVAG